MTEPKTLRSLMREALEFVSPDLPVNVRVIRRNEHGSAVSIKEVPVEAAAICIEVADLDSAPELLRT